jgi:hypothetical protein
MLGSARPGDHDNLARHLFSILAAPTQAKIGDRLVDNQKNNYYSKELKAIDQREKDVTGREDPMKQD